MVINKGKLTAAVFLFIIINFGAAKAAHAQTVITGQRIYGNDRYETAVNISKIGWPNGADAAVIATGKDFPDALCAAPLAKSLNAPILLTQDNELNESVKSELVRLGIKEVYIVGGTGAISYSVQSKIASMGIKCKRIMGDDRYGTSIAVANSIASHGEAIVATGEDFPDALSIASWAAANGVPILLTKSMEIPEALMEYMEKNNIKTTYVIGGAGAVSNSVMDKLPGAVRLGGSDRYDTNIQILRKFAGDFDLNRIFMATGTDYPDALSGSALSAMWESPMILTSPDGTSAAKAYADSNSGKFKEVYMLGGPTVVTDDTAGNILPQLVTDIDIVMPYASVGTGKQMKVSAKLVTAKGTRMDGEIEYAIEDTSIGKIDSQGNLTGLKEGNTKIVASSGIVKVRKTVSVRDKKLVVVDAGHGGWDGGASAVMLDGSKPYEYREAALNLKIAQKLKAALEQAGYSVVMTRESDMYIALGDRANIANSLNADLFISIHHDSLTRSSSGTSAFYSNYKPGIDTKGIYAVAAGNAPVYDNSGYRIGYLTKGKTYTFVREADGGIYIIFNGATGRVTINDVGLYDSNPSMVSKQSQSLAESINSGMQSLGLLARGASDRNLAVTRLTNGVSVLVEVGFISNPYEFQKISQDAFQNNVADTITRAIDNFFTM